MEISGPWSGGTVQYVEPYLVGMFPRFCPKKLAKKIWHRYLHFFSPETAIDHIYLMVIPYIKNSLYTWYSIRYIPTIRTIIWPRIIRSPGLIILIEAPAEAIHLDQGGGKWLQPMAEKKWWFWSFIPSTNWVWTWFNKWTLGLSINMWILLTVIKPGLLETLPLTISPYECRYTFSAGIFQCHVRWPQSILFPFLSWLFPLLKYIELITMHYQMNTWSL